MRALAERLLAGRLRAVEAFLCSSARKFLCSSALSVRTVQLWLPAGYAAPAEPLRRDRLKRRCRPVPHLHVAERYRASELGGEAGGRCGRRRGGGIGGRTAGVAALERIRSKACWIAFHVEDEAHVAG